MGKFKKLVVAGVVLTGLAGIGSINSPTQQSATPQVSTPSNRQQLSVSATEQSSAPVITTKNESVASPVAYTTSTVNDASLETGKTQLKTAGSNGVRTITYKVTYTDGVETGREQISDEITTQPVNQVTSIGTKAPTPSCSNGSYTNTAGNTVCRPAASVSVPDGATARCSDGTYSFSQSRRGTCSHHGGVATWL